jgi:ribosomal-protein-alanine N-acetyltransferase
MSLLLTRPRICKAEVMVTLVPLTTKDGGALEQIHAASFPDGWTRETFDHLLTENQTCGWMATSLDGIPLGFILARVVTEILTFAVSPPSQRQGIGRYLLKELMNFLKSVQCVKIFLEVAVDNKATIDLYTSVGFKSVGTRPNYYQRNAQTFISASVMVFEDSR